MQSPPSVRRIGAVLGGLLLVLAATFGIGAGSATAEPVPAGCRADDSIARQLTVDCEPGAGNGQHAYIRCTDIFGIKHTHIGTPIGEQGGRSTAVCGPDEVGNT
ncbi:hypothetical protein AW168_05085 [Nocardia brasiliensis]|uniref:Uncharacterized protein n=2 Tax=Nocardia brasiliensis TaxID=37326 RepID=K0F486_NOCB7|nr:hypothetical protein O3I_030205 [Nocardia brasiliensis ATCC 700358]OCF91181.1 hypothetical protein AW168_05085 [Nocardia brasiliensis]